MISAPPEIDLSTATDTTLQQAKEAAIGQLDSNMVKKVETSENNGVENDSNTDKDSALGITKAENVKLEALTDSTKDWRKTARKECSNCKTKLKQQMHIKMHKISDNRRQMLLLPIKTLNKWHKNIDDYFTGQAGLSKYCQCRQKSFFVVSYSTKNRIYDF